MAMHTIEDASDEIRHLHKSAASAQAAMTTDSSEPLRQATLHIRRTLTWIGLFSLGLNLVMVAAPFALIAALDEAIAAQTWSTLFLLLLALCAPPLVMAGIDAGRTRILQRAALGFDHRLADPVLAARRANGSVRRLPEPVRLLEDITILRSALAERTVTPLFDAPWLVAAVGASVLIHPVLGAVAAGAALIMTALVAVQYRHGRDEGLPATMAGRVRPLLLAILMGAGVWLMAGEDLSAGAFIAATILMSRALVPMENLAAAWRAVLGARAAYGRLDRILRTVRPARKILTLQTPAANLVLDRVSSVAADGSSILRAVSFRLEPGDTLGIAGPTGAGKSMLAALLAGIETPSAGQILLDGIDLARWTVESPGRHIGYLPQNVKLSDGTVAANIARHRGADRAAVVKAAMAAGVHAMILALPQGYETRIGRGGHPLPAGLRQRIGLARALFGNPRLIVLDDPATHLDAGGEMALFDAIEAARGAGAAVIMIASHPYLLARMNWLLALRDGGIEKFGPRHEVLPALFGPVLVPRPAEPAPPVGKLKIFPSVVGAASLPQTGTST